MSIPKMKYFKEKEWKYSPEKTNPELMLTLDAIRELSGVPINIHVAYDTSGHSSKSQHYIGNAVDFHFKPVLTPSEEYAIISMFPQIKGIGYYPMWNNPGWHIDLRDKRDITRWVRKNKVYYYDKKTFIDTLKGGV